MITIHSNMDLQYIAESSLTLTQYVSSYVTKAEKSALQDIWTEIASSGSIYSRLLKFVSGPRKTTLMAGGIKFSLST